MVNFVSQGSKMVEGATKVSQGIIANKQFSPDKPQESFVSQETNNQQSGKTDCKSDHNLVNILPLPPLLYIHTFIMSFIQAFSPLPAHTISTLFHLLLASFKYQVPSHSKCPLQLMNLNLGSSLPHINSSNFSSSFLKMQLLLFLVEQG
jgi:hypothetical protein